MVVGARSAASSSLPQLVLTAQHDQEWPLLSQTDSFLDNKGVAITDNFRYHGRILILNLEIDFKHMQ